jgi:hypothetical protein
MTEPTGANQPTGADPGDSDCLDDGAVTGPQPTDGEKHPADQELPAGQAPGEDTRPRGEVRRKAGVKYKPV